MKRRTISTIAVFLASLIWGLAFVAQLVGMDYVGPLTYTGVRFGLGALSLIPVALVLERGVDRAKMRKTLIAGLVAGVILFIAVTLQQFGLVMTNSASKAGFITGLYTVIVPIIGIFLRKKTTAFTWIAAVVACGGMYLLSAGDSFAGSGIGVGIGDLVLLLGAVFWAFHILAIDRYVNDVSPIRLAIVQFAVCSVLSMACAFTFEEVTIAGIFAGGWSILYGGFLSAGVAFTLQIIAQRDVEPTKAAIAFSAESLFSALGAAVLLGELLSAKAYIGCALIFSGIVISQIKWKKIT